MLVHVQESTHVGKTANWPNSQKIPLTWGINWCTGQHDSIAGDFPWGECPKLPLVETEWGCSGFRAANHPKGFSQLEHYNIWLQKSKEWPPCMSHRLKRRKRVKDWWILNKTFKISNGTCSLTMRDISCNQMRQITFTQFRPTTWWSNGKLVSTEGLPPGGQMESLSTQFRSTAWRSDGKFVNTVQASHAVIKWKDCKTVTMGCGSCGWARNTLLFLILFFSLL